MLSFIISVFETNLRGKIPANNSSQSASRSFREYVSITVATNIFHGTHLNILRPEPFTTATSEKHLRIRKEDLAVHSFLFIELGISSAYDTIEFGFVFDIP